MHLNIIFHGLGIILGGKKKKRLYTYLSLWRKWIEFLNNCTLLKLWLLPYFPNDVYPCGHYKGLLCHFNNQIRKFPLSIKSKQVNLKVTDIPARTSTSIKPDVLPLPLPRVSIFLWSVVKASLSIEASLRFTWESIRLSTAVMLSHLSRLLPLCNSMFKMKISWSSPWKYLLMSKVPSDLQQYNLLIAIKMKHLFRGGSNLGTKLPVTLKVSLISAYI